MRRSRRRALARPAAYAVVAQEVKSLASQTARASQRIAEHVEAIQGATANAVDGISSIASTMNEAQGFTSIIASAIEHQSTATAEIVQSVIHAAASAEVRNNKYEEPVGCSCGSRSIGGASPFLRRRRRRSDAPAQRHRRPFSAPSGVSMKAGGSSEEASATWSTCPGAGWENRSGS